MDTYYWLIRLVFHVGTQFEYVSLSYIQYTGTTLQYIPQLRYLDIDLEALEFAPFYPSISCIPSRSNSTRALREPLFIIVCFACNFLLVAVLLSY